MFTQTCVDSINFFPRNSYDALNLEAALSLRAKEATNINSELEERIWTLTEPINGQYPRPWMTTLAAPADAKIFIVGFNQATEYPASIVGTHDHFVDALFNRKGQTCRALYNRVRADDGPSPTRNNIDSLTTLLGRAGLHKVLETNVICYSSKDAAELSDPMHNGGYERGSDIFRSIFDFIRPPVLIVDGKKALKTFVRLVGAGSELKALVGANLPPDKTGPITIAKARLKSPQYDNYDPVVYAMRSLGQPEFNKWKARSAAYFVKLVEDIGNELSA